MIRARSEPLRPGHGAAELRACEACGPALQQQPNHERSTPTIDRRAAAAVAGPMVAPTGFVAQAGPACGQGPWGAVLQARDLHDDGVAAVGSGDRRNLGRAATETMAWPTTPR